MSIQVPIPEEYGLLESSQSQRRQESSVEFWSPGRPRGHLGIKFPPRCVWWLALSRPLLGRDLVNVFDNYLIACSSVRGTPYIRHAIYKRNHGSGKPAQGVLGVSLDHRTSPSRHRLTYVSPSHSLQFRESSDSSSRRSLQSSIRCLERGQSSRRVQGSGG